MKNIEYILEKLSPQINEIKYHKLYKDITSIHKLRFFMECHVFAVWDFMCLLKELHKSLVSTSAPWFPPKDAFSANLISSILIDEESDLSVDGEYYLSHFDLYIAAMKETGANTMPIKNFLNLLANDKSLHESALCIHLEPSIFQFIETTFSFFNSQTHQLASSFVFGREAITAPMFTPLLEDVDNLDTQGSNHLKTFMYYLKRHIELDKDDHFPKAVKMIINLTGKDDAKWEEVHLAAKISLESRIKLLNYIEREINYF